MARQSRRFGRPARGVTVGYRNAAGRLESMESQYCICAMPFSILKNVDADFAPDVKGIVDGSVY